MAITLREIKEDISRVLSNAANARVRRFTPSQTLRDALRVVRDGQRWFVGVPHYWAVYYHDGRATSRSTRPNGFLVWYKNPKDDPRHRGNFPVRASQLRSLRQAGISLERLRADIESGRAVIARSSPRNGGAVAGRPFFVRGLRGFFAAGGSELAQREFTRLLKREAPKAFKLTVIKHTVRLA